MVKRNELVNFAMVTAEVPEEFKKAWLSLLTNEYAALQIKNVKNYRPASNLPVFIRDHGRYRGCITL